MSAGINPISVGQMAIGMVPILVAIAISSYYKLGLTKALVIGVVRATVQLFIMGYAFLWLFKINNPWLIMALVVIMIGVASQAGVQRLKSLQSRSFRRKYQKILFASIFISSAIITGYLLLIVIQPEPFWDGMYVIPIAGMMIGQAMNAASLAVERYRNELQLQSRHIDALLAIGATSQQASSKAMRVAIGAAMMPTINGMMVLGIVSLPGMMSGQILSGVSPELAIRYQLLVFFAISAVTSAVSFIAIQMSRKLYFTKEDQFIPPKDAEI